MVTRSVSFGPSAGTADTDSTIGSAYTFANSGAIKKIRIALYQGVEDKATCGILKLSFKRLSGPFEFATGYSGVVGTSAQGACTVTPPDVIDVDIPYNNGEQVTVTFKGAEATEEVTVSLTMVEA